jgi:hypothetical protein
LTLLEARAILKPGVATMGDKDEVRDLMTKLMRAVEASLSSSTAVRDALAELVRNGYEARLFFVANADSAGASEEGSGEVEEDEAPVLREIGAVIDDGDLSAELTKHDCDFLKSLNIRLESG